MHVMMSLSKSEQAAEYSLCPYAIAMPWVVRSSPRCSDIMLGHIFVHKSSALLQLTNQQIEAPRCVM